MFSRSKPSHDNVPNRQSAPSQAPAVARSNGSSGSSFSIIGDGIIITGNIESKVDLHIDGEVIGDVKCLSLVQGPSSKIQGAIVAQNASLSGSVEGSIDAGDLAIASTARISGDVSYENVTIEQGGHVDGKFKHRSSTSPNLAKSTVNKSELSMPLELTSGDKAA
ncbi:polymer-forming cytoskeletal protein [Parasphingorhabdus flavimaris]|uniref:Polymer-forming cytoskeletal protein n=1 Tax=Parasphingorhabdus flavimaris TaxID=266812 RepID=A0ABX2N5T5_9SPHN|nr:polymer-forming cytoskeletal protein [Parasphingorhabdus flavimaris]NVD29090.1 polymer-forming cytoskeletal protein [Parasphingorhabdus flavimaris]